MNKETDTPPQQVGYSKYSDASGESVTAHTCCHESADAMSYRISSDTPCYHPLLKWSSFKITSVLILTIYAIILACSWESRSGHWFTTSSILVALLILTHFVIIYASRNLHNPLTAGLESVSSKSWYKTHYSWALLVSACLAYVAISALLSTSWLQTDEWTFINGSHEPMNKRWDAAVLRYNTWVARFGDFYMKLFPLSITKWQLWVINPLLFVSIPFALFRLFKKKKNDCICSIRGILFFWFVLAIFMMSARTSNPRAYIEFAASTNYLWPSVLILWLLSFYNPNNWNWQDEKKQQLLAYIIFPIAFIAGWGMECTAVTIIPLLLLWVAYLCYRKIRIPAFCWSGLIGSVWGGFILLSSPAHAARLAKISQTRALDCNKMTPDELLAFVQNLDWDKVNMLKGMASLISLDGIPLWQHVYFLPYWWEGIWKEASIPIISFLVLFLSILLGSLYKVRVKDYSISLGIAALGICIWLSYLVKSIPTGMSFLPGTFAISSACAYLFLAHTEKDGNWSARQTFFSVVMVLWSLIIYLPAGIEAWNAQPYRHAMLSDIITQARSGKSDVVINNPIPFKVSHRNSVHLIAWLNRDKNHYQNQRAAEYFRVRSITQTEKRDKLIPVSENTKPCSCSTTTITQTKTN